MYRLVAILALIGFASLAAISTGCGTCVGNPECAAGRDMGTNGFSPFTSQPDFQGPIDQYAAFDQTQAPASVTNCGSFTEKSALEDVTAGRDCIRTSLKVCTPARYLLDERKTDGSRFVSFVAVEIPADKHAACELRVHSVSTDALRFVGDSEKTCDTPDPVQELELSCDVGK